MTTFDDRDRAYENKFAHDEELAFKANAKRNKMLGLWAAGLMGKSGQEADTYAGELAVSDFESGSHQGIVERLISDFTKAGLSISQTEIRAEMDRLLPLARRQMMEPKA